MKLQRFEGNPILKPSDKPWENRAVFNCAVAEYGGNKLLIYRAQGDDEVSRLGMATLKSPSEVGERKTEPIFEPDPDSEYESLGVEDPRIVKIGKSYYMTYVAASKYPSVIDKPQHPREADWRVRVSLAKTTDFGSWLRYGVIIGHIDSKDAVLFPEKIDGGLCMLHRVIPQVRIAIAPDGRNYKERGVVFGPRVGMWDEERVGIGAQPIKCPYGWVLFYHATDANKVYRIGIALLDLDDPSLVIARTAEPMLEPEAEFEKNGRVNNVVFTCGVMEDETKYWVYYGGADTVVCVASMDKSEVWNWAKDELAKSKYHEFEQVGMVRTLETEERQEK